MRGNTQGGCAGNNSANLVCIRLDPTGNIKVGHRVIEGTAIPEVVFGATEAAVPGFHGPGQAAVPLNCRSGVVRRRSFAAHLVKAIAFAGALVVETLDELAGIKV